VRRQQPRSRGLLRVVAKPCRSSFIVVRDKESGCLPFKCQMPCRTYHVEKALRIPWASGWAAVCAARGFASGALDGPARPQYWFRLGVGGGEKKIVKLATAVEQNFRAGFPQSSAGWYAKAAESVSQAAGPPNSTIGWWRIFASSGPDIENSQISRAYEHIVQVVNRNAQPPIQENTQLAPP
jgi:hypothetical protein